MQGLISTPLFAVSSAPLENKSKNYADFGVLRGNKIIACTELFAILQATAVYRGG